MANYDTAKFIFDMVQTVMIAIVAIMNWLHNRQRATAAEMQKTTERIATLEAQIKNVPTHEDYQELGEKISGINSAMMEIKGEFSGVKTTLGVIHDWLLRGGK